MRFVHAATRTRDLDAALEFYRLLGLREESREELEKGKATLVFLQAPGGDFQIELIYNWGKDDGYDGGERFAHFAFKVQGVEDAYSRLIAAGAGDVGRPPVLFEGVGPMIAFVADPDGNWIELIEV
jgi:lactoylglutathione lyase